MSGATFDPALKVLVESSPADWLDFLGRPREPVQVIDTDLSAVTKVADKVLKVGERDPYICHLEFVSGHDSAGLPKRLNTRSALLEQIHDCGVLTTVFVLHPEADSPQLTGRHSRSVRGEREFGHLDYRVIRLWQEDPEKYLAGGAAVVQLAPLTRVTPTELPGMIERMAERFREPESESRAQELWTATNILMGTRFPQDEIERLLRGVMTMRESVTYQAIWTGGGGEWARQLILDSGTARFGAPSDAEYAALVAVADLERLREINTRIHAAASWAVALGLPARRRRRTQPPAS